MGRATATSAGSWRQRAGGLFVVHWDQCIGAGGEGEVFLGRCVKSWRPCAIKVSTRLSRTDAASQLRLELQRCWQAAGEGVVGLLGWNLDAPRPFLVFELAAAGTLADEMTELRAKDCVYHPVRGLQRVRAILAALAKVHARGLVHRDVKPANLLRFGDELKFGDFGTGLTLGRAPGISQAFVGTRMYAAPEQRRGEPVDERADLYAVGCILHEMITGRVPSDAPALASGRYPNALVLPDLEDLVQRMVDPDPERRPVDAQDAIARVDRVIAAYERARRVWECLQLGPSPY